MADIVAFPMTMAYVPGLQKDGNYQKVPIPLWIEVKAAKGRTTPEQDAFAEIVKAEGHAYIVARSIEDVEAP